jgi:hypothetical protein
LVDLNAIETVTYNGTSTVRVQAMRMMVLVQLTRSIRILGRRLPVWRVVSARVAFTSS